MPPEQVTVEFHPHRQAVYVLSGTKILEAAARAALTIDTPCGGKGTCGRCRVQITSGASAPTGPERQIFSEAELEVGWRLSCQAEVRTDTVVSIPPASLFGDQHQILTDTGPLEATEIQPAVRKVYLSIPTGALGDEAALAAVLAERLELKDAQFELTTQMRERIDAAGGAVTAVLADGELIDLEPGDTRADCYGVAFDIGTTTLVGALLDLRNGDELAVTSAMNPQRDFGDDVLTRITYARDGAEHPKQLRSAVVSAVGRMIDDLSRQAGIDRRNIYELTFAGNTTMQHLLCGLGVARLGEIPFAPARKDALTVAASELGITVHPRALAYVFGVIGGFVGGDTVAGVLATQLSTRQGAVLMIDIGTNGEIIVARDGSLWAASTAAGPAFEGGRISCGMRAAAGAIEKVIFDGDVRMSVIGGAAPAGLCGTGLVDLTAELLAAGIVSSTGRMLGPDELPASVPTALKDRVSRDADGRVRFLVAGGRGGAPEIVLTERDVRELQLATAAIRSGVKFLLSRAGVDGADLASVLIAGGFGSFMRRSNAQRIGLLPGEVDHDRIHYVGNTSLAGAKWALLCVSARRRGEQIAGSVQHVELSGDAQFQTVFADAMIFPS